VKVEVDGEVLHTAADGNGPVHALDLALRKALGAFYPALDDVHLVDYKVRIIDGDAATAARTRVIIETGHESGTWITAGADANIITASLAALHDSFEYAIWQLDARRERRDELASSRRALGPRPLPVQA
jgi:2-isopropylmalate synthase